MASLPDQGGCTQLLMSMLRRHVSTTTVKPGPDGDLIVAAHYVDGQNKLVGACFADKSFVVLAGAAFSLVPAEAAQDALKEKVLDEVVQENFAEVLNICSRLFNVGNDTKITLSRKEFPPVKRSDESANMLKKHTKRVDYEIKIDDYGKGRIVLVLP